MPSKLEQRALAMLTAPYNEARYRPSYHRARFGLSVELYVRVQGPADPAERHEWVRVTRWYRSALARCDALQQLRWQLGLYGQQLAQGTLRRIRLIGR